jgi:hypothetical protein
LTKRTGRYDPEVLSALDTALGLAPELEEKRVMAMDLADDMILVQDVRLEDGRLLVARGYRVNRTLRERMKTFAQRPGIKEPIRVLVPTKRAVGA